MGMRLKKRHAPHIASKVGTDIATSKFITNNSTLEKIIAVVTNIVEQSVDAETRVDDKASEFMREYDEQIERGGLNARDLFWHIKKQVAEEMDFPLQWEDRLNLLSHEILEALKAQKLISFEVSELVIKNVIIKAIIAYSRIYDAAEEAVERKIRDVKKAKHLELHYGSEEYEIVFAKLYEEELRRRGIV